MERFNCVTINGEASMVSDPQGDWVKYSEVSDIILAFMTEEQLERGEDR